MPWKLLFKESGAWKISFCPGISLFSARKIFKITRLNIYVVLTLIYWIQFNLNGWLSQQSEYRLLASQRNLEDKAQTFFLGGRWFCLYANVKIPFNIMVLKNCDKKKSIVSPWWSWTTWSWWWRGEQMELGPSPRSWRWRCSPGCKTCPFADLKDRLWECLYLFILFTNGVRVTSQKSGLCPH